MKSIRHWLVYPNCFRSVSFADITYCGHWW